MSIGSDVVGAMLTALELKKVGGDSTQPRGESTVLGVMAAMCYVHVTVSADASAYKIKQIQSHIAYLQVPPDQACQPLNSSCVLS